MEQKQNAESETHEYNVKIPDKFINQATVKGQCDADCKVPVHRQDKIWCLQTGGCSNATACSCVLYRLRKDWDDFDEDPPWERLNGRKHPYEPNTYYYRCWCVK